MGDAMEGRASVVSQRTHRETVSAGVRVESASEAMGDLKVAECSGIPWCATHKRLSHVETFCL